MPVLAFDVLKAFSKESELVRIMCSENCEFRAVAFYIPVTCIAGLFQKKSWSLWRSGAGIPEVDVTTEDACGRACNSPGDYLEVRLL